MYEIRPNPVTAVKSLLLNHAVLAVLSTGYGKSLIFQSFVVAKELLNSAKACVLVICPLNVTSIIQDQIAKAKALVITCVSLHVFIEEVKLNTFQLVFSSVERAMEKDFRQIGSKSTNHNPIA